MIDETNNVQLPCIIRLMQRMNVVMTPQLLKIIEVSQQDVANQNQFIIFITFSYL